MSADKRHILRATLLVGLLIAGGAALMAFEALSALRVLIGWAVIYLFAGLAIFSLIAWIVRKARRPRFTIPPGTPIERIAITLVIAQLGFGVAALILLAAWLAALFLWPQIGVTLLDALILTIIVSALSSFTLRTVLNLTVAIQGPTEGLDA